MFGGEDWKMNVILTAFMVPGLVTRANNVKGHDLTSFRTALFSSFSSSSTSSSSELGHREPSPSEP